MNYTTYLNKETRKAHRSVNRIRKNAAARRSSRPILARLVEAKRPLTKRELCSRAYVSGLRLNQSRHRIITAMMNVAGISKAGASTYYQNLKSGVWTV